MLKLFSYYNSFFFKKTSFLKYPFERTISSIDFGFTWAFLTEYFCSELVEKMLNESYFFAKTKQKTMGCHLWKITFDFGWVHFCVDGWCVFIIFASEHQLTTTTTMKTLITKRITTTTITTLTTTLITKTIATSLIKITTYNKYQEKNRFLNSKPYCLTTWFYLKYLNFFF